MAKRAFRAQMETLERRETPTASTAIHALAGSAIAVRGSGNGQVTSFAMGKNHLALTANINGKDASEGRFTGQVMGAISIGKNPASATGVATITDLIGDTIDLRLKGKVLMPKGSSTAVGTFTFSVVGGTGAFAGATGSGSGTGTINESVGAVTFMYHGRVKP